MIFIEAVGSANLDISNPVHPTKKRERVNDYDPV